MEHRHTDTNDLHPQVSSEAAEASARPSKAKKNQQRTCIVTREESDKSDLLRFVVHPDGNLHFDLNQKLPGRGLYVSYEAPHVKTALQKNLFSKAAKRQVSIPDTLMTQIELQLRGAALNHIGLCKRASELISSLIKIEKHLRINRIACYITSSPEGSDGYRSVTRKAGDVPVIRAFTNEELSKILNIENAVHLVMKPGNIANSFLKLINLYTQLTDQNAERK